MIFSLRAVGSHWSFTEQKQDVVKGGDLEGMVSTEDGATEMRHQGPGGQVIRVGDERLRLCPKLVWEMQLHS